MENSGFVKSGKKYMVKYFQSKQSTANYVLPGLREKEMIIIILPHFLPNIHSTVVVINVFKLY